MIKHEKVKIVTNGEINVSVDDDFSHLSASKACFIWPSAIELANHIASNPHLVRNKKILELGCGVGLPAVVAAKLGAYSVTATDADIEYVNKTKKLNPVVQKILTCKKYIWGNVGAILHDFDNPDLIIAADCFYESHQFEQIMKTVAYLLHCNKSCKFLFSHPVRDSLKSIRSLLKEYKLRGEVISSNEKPCNILICIISFDDN